MRCEVHNHNADSPCPTCLSQTQMTGEENGLVFFNYGKNLFTENREMALKFLKDKRHENGLALQNNALKVHDIVADYMKFNNIQDMPLWRRPHCYYNNFVVEYGSRITRPLVKHGGDGVGIVLDKVLGQTMSSLSPMNIVHAVSNPELAAKYLHQVKGRMTDFYDVYDSSNPANTLFNYNWLMARRFKEATERFDHRWENELVSNHSKLRFLSQIEDKSKHLACGVIDVTTDNIAEIVGKFIVAKLIYGTGQRKKNTQAGVNHWESKRLYRYALPGPSLYVGRFAFLKPMVKMSRNPRTFFAITGYYIATNIGQNISDHKKMNLIAPKFLDILKGHKIDVYKASKGLALTKSLKKDE
ncbi:MAG: hypothetical protein ACJAV1_002152 [Paraglaciecola sp.]|jgi:hypothetical protein